MLLIKEETAQAIHDYLYTRPMQEVEGLVMALRQLPPMPTPNSDKKVTDTK